MSMSCFIRNFLYSIFILSIIKTNLVSFENTEKLNASLSEEQTIQALLVKLKNNSENHKACCQIAFLLSDEDYHDKFVRAILIDLHIDKKELSSEIKDALSELQAALKRWKDIYQEQTRLTRTYYDKTKYFSSDSLSLARAKLSFLSVSHDNDEKTIEEQEIEDLRLEAEVLRNDAYDQFGKACLEAAGAGVSIASGQEWIGIAALYYASKDIIAACQEYNDAILLDQQADELEDSFLEEDENIQDEENDKRWWEFWK